MTTREEAVRLLTQTFVACSHEHPWPAGDMLRAALKVPPNDVDAAIGEDLEPLVDALLTRLGLTVAPPPSPSREEAAERMAAMLGEVDTAGLSPNNLRVEAAYIIDTLGLVAVDPALVERVREWRATSEVEHTANGGRCYDDCRGCFYAREAELEMVDVVLEQLGGAR